ncbi:MAG: betaine--homocysteine S-methyltransferase [Proteobacteria bacterium]|nr:MAG: betaine--homocysteine S-methyltransferase [Pseudomonadota bacterium]
MNKLQSLLETRQWLLADGATGTNYFQMGLGPGDAPELWNIDYPERVLDLHRRFVAAGSDIILTNTFGGCSYRLKLHKAQDRVHELNRAAARIARQAADEADHEVIVAGSMGPTGEILEPVGTLSHADAVAAFKEQAKGLKDGGVDVLWLETMSSIEELRAATEAARLAGLDYVATLSFDTNGNTMMGVTPGGLADTCLDLEPGPLAFGTNCGVGAAEVVATILTMHAALGGREANLVAKANCGIPEYHDGNIVYNGTPDLMASYAVLARDAGARIIGGCCGTTPEHVASMRRALETVPHGDAPEIELVVRELGPITEGARRCCSGESRPAAADSRRAGRRRRRSAG